MSLFLKNLPKSFFRAIVSSRPIFNKATSLFSSISANAQQSAKLPILAVGRSHTRTICYSSNEDRRKSFVKKYSLYNERRYSKKAKKSPKSPAKSKPKAQKIVSGPVDCSVNQGVIECSVDCDKIGDGRQQSSKKSQSSCSLKKEDKAFVKEEEIPISKKKFIPKYKKESNESSRCDVKALTGTWVSKKCMKFDFDGKKPPRRDESTRPVRLEDGATVSLPEKCKKTSSKDLARKASTERKKVTCKKSSSESKAEAKKETKSEPCKKFVKEPKSASSSKSEVKKKEPKCDSQSEVQKKESACKSKVEKKESACKSKVEKKESACKSKVEKKESTCKSKEEKKQSVCDHKSETKEEEDPCAPKKSHDDCKSHEKTEETPCEESGESNKVDQSPMLLCIEECKNRRKDKDKAKPKHATKAKSKKHNGNGKHHKNGKGKKHSKDDKKKDKSCKPCASKKEAKKAKSKGKKRDGKKEEKHKSSGKKVSKESKAPKCSEEKKEKKPAEEAENVCPEDKGANTSLVMNTYDQEKDSCEEMDKKSMEIIAKLKKELEECRKAKAKEREAKAKECLPKIKLDSKLPKPHEQDKDVISGSKNFIKSVCDGFFNTNKEKISKEKKSPGKSKSAPVVKKTKPGKPIKIIKSAGCTFDLEPSYCERKKVEKEKKKAKTEEAKPKTDCKNITTTPRKKKPAPCTYDTLKAATKKDACKKEEKPKIKSSCAPKKKKSDPKADCTKDKKEKKDKKPNCGFKSKEHEKEKDEKPECGSKEKESKPICSKENKKKPPCEPTELKSEKAVKKAKDEKPECSSKQKESKPICSKEDKKRPPGEPTEKADKKDDKSCPKIPVKCGDKKKHTEAKPKPSCSKTEEKEKKPICSPKKTKSETKATTKQASLCDNTKHKESKKERFTCKKEEHEEPDFCKNVKKEEKLPPDQSPIMQCIALCKKKKKANTPQKGKGIPPRDKKDCSKDPKVFKKLVEFDETTNKCKEETKDEIKNFVPCKYEDIKPGIRRAEDSESDTGEIYKKFVPGECGDSEKREEEEKPKTKCDELGEKQTGDSVHVSSNCAKFQYSCSECEKEEQEKCEEHEDPCQRVEEKKSKNDDLIIANQKQLVDRKNSEIIARFNKEIKEGKRSKSQGVTKEEKEEVNVGFFRSILNAFFKAKKSSEKVKSDHTIKNAKSKHQLKKTRSGACEIDLDAKPKDEKKLSKKKSKCYVKPQVPVPYEEFKPTIKKKKTFTCENIETMDLTKNYVRPCPPDEYRELTTLTTKKEEKSAYEQMPEDANKIVECKKYLNANYCKQSHRIKIKRSKTFVKSCPPDEYGELKKTITKEKKPSKIPVKSPLMQCLLKSALDAKAKQPPKVQKPCPENAKFFEKLCGFHITKEETSNPPNSEQNKPSASKSVPAVPKVTTGKYLKKSSSADDKKPLNPKPSGVTLRSKSKVRFQTSLKFGKIDCVSEEKPKDPEQIRPENKEIKRSSKHNDPEAENLLPLLRVKSPMTKARDCKIDIKLQYCEISSKKAEPKKKEQRKKYICKNLRKKPAKQEKKEEIKPAISQKKKEDDCEERVKEENEECEKQPDETDNTKKVEPYDVQVGTKCPKFKNPCPDFCKDEKNKDESKNEIKPFVPCKYEEIKSGIRKPDDKKTEDKKDDIKPFVPCKYENIKPGIRKIEDENKNKECEDEKAETKKEEKPEQNKNEPKKSSKDVIRIVPCEDKSKKEEPKKKEARKRITCKNLMRKKSTEEKKKSLSQDAKDEIKPFVPGKHEKIKPPVLQAESKQEKEEIKECEEGEEMVKTKSTCPKFKNPCPDFKDRDDECKETEEKGDETESCEEQKDKDREHGKSFERFGIKEDPCKKVEELKKSVKQSKNNEVKHIVPCQHEEIKTPVVDVNQKEVKQKDKSEQKKDIAKECADFRDKADECKESDKDIVHSDSKQKHCHQEKSMDDVKETRKDEIQVCEEEEVVKVKSTSCPDFRDKENDCKETTKGADKEIKSFAPCKYEEIKPGIRKPENEEGENEECDESAKDVIKQFVPCKNEKIKPPLVHTEQADKSEKTEEEIKTSMLCKDENTKPAIRLPEEEQKCEKPLESKIKKEEVKSRHRHKDCSVKKVKEDLSKKKENSKSREREMQKKTVQSKNVCPHFENPCPDFRKKDDECEKEEDDICQSKKDVEEKDICKEKEENKPEKTDNSLQPCEPHEIVENITLDKAANSALIIGTYDKKPSSSVVDQKTEEIIAQLKRDIEECKKAVRRESQVMGECVQSPKLDSPLPKPQEQPKGFFSGGVSFFKSICNAIFPSKKSAKPKVSKKSKSTSDVKKKKSKKEMRKTKSSGDCKKREEEKKSICSAKKKESKSDCSKKKSDTALKQHNKESKSECKETKSEPVMSKKSDKYECKIDLNPKHCEKSIKKEKSTKKKEKSMKAEETKHKFNCYKPFCENKKTEFESETCHKKEEKKESSDFVPSAHEDIKPCQKSKSEPDVAKQKDQKNVSPKCKIDLNPKHCEKPGPKKKENSECESKKNKENETKGRERKKQKPCRFEEVNPKNVKIKNKDPCRPCTKKKHSKINLKQQMVGNCKQEQKASASEKKEEECEPPKEKRKKKSKRCSKSKSDSALSKSKTKKVAKKSKSCDAKIDIKKECKKSKQKEDKPRKNLKKEKCTYDDKPKLKHCHKETLSPSDVEKRKDTEECKRKGPIEDTCRAKPKTEDVPDQSPIMKCIALCKLRQLAKTPQKGKGVPPRDKKPYDEDPSVKKLVEFYETKKECDKDNTRRRPKRPIPPCKYKHLKKDSCEEEVEKKTRNEEKEEIKIFVPCRHEKLKPATRGRVVTEEKLPIESKCTEKDEDEIKTFAPCKHENILPGLRKPEGKHGEEQETKKFVKAEPCESEDHEKNVKETEQETKEDVKAEPCESEDHEMNAKETEQETKEVVKAEPCESEDHEKNVKETEQKTKEVIKAEPCKSEDHEKNVKETLLSSGHTRYTLGTKGCPKLKNPCPALQNKKEEHSCEKVVERFAVKEDPCKKKSDEKAKPESKEKIKPFVPCKYETIKPGIRHESSSNATKEELCRKVSEEKSKKTETHKKATRKKISCASLREKRKKKDDETKKAEDTKTKHTSDKVESNELAEKKKQECFNENPACARNLNPSPCLYDKDDQICEKHEKKEESICNESTGKQGKEDVAVSSEVLNPCPCLPKKERFGVRKDPCKHEKKEKKEKIKISDSKKSESDKNDKTKKAKEFESHKKAEEEPCDKSQKKEKNKEHVNEDECFEVLNPCPCLPKEVKRFGVKGDPCKKKEKKKDDKKAKIKDSASKTKSEKKVQETKVEDRKEVKETCDKPKNTEDSSEVLNPCPCLSIKDEVCEEKKQSERFSVKEDPCKKKDKKKEDKKEKKSDDKTKIKCSASKTKSEIKKKDAKSENAEETKGEDCEEVKETCDKPNHKEDSSEVLNPCPCLSIKNEVCEEKKQSERFSVKEDPCKKKDKKKKDKKEKKSDDKAKIKCSSSETKSEIKKNDARSEKTKETKVCDEKKQSERFGVKEDPCKKKDKKKEDKKEKIKISCSKTKSENEKIDKSKKSEEKKDKKVTSSETKPEKTEDGKCELERFSENSECAKILNPCPCLYNKEDVICDKHEKEETKDQEKENTEVLNPCPCLPEKYLERFLVKEDPCKKQDKEKNKSKKEKKKRIKVKCSILKKAEKAKAKTGQKKKAPEEKEKTKCDKLTEKQEEGSVLPSSKCKKLKNPCPSLHAGKGDHATQEKEKDHKCKCEICKCVDCKCKRGGEDERYGVKEDPCKIKDKSKKDDKKKKVKVLCSNIRKRHEEKSKETCNKTEKSKVSKSDPKHDEQKPECQKEDNEDDLKKCGRDPCCIYKYYLKQCERRKVEEDHKKTKK